MTDNVFDSAFDFRADASGDPDANSPPLRRYHRKLWSKPLPGGAVFSLDDVGPAGYLSHDSELGQFSLSSDSIIHTYTYFQRVKHFIEDVPKEDRKSFIDLANTIGGYILFPGNEVGDQGTINVTRGRSGGGIDDRFDLTLECIRRHYTGGSSPLSTVLARYEDFFRLFSGFGGYVDFFLLQDLVSSDRTKVRFFLEFQDFPARTVPQSVEEYAIYRVNAMEFCAARNVRMNNWVQSNS